MMGIKKNKIIRDTVHGYIQINNDELSVIDNRLFQRLLRIRQGLNNAAYPTSTHTRFEHSLGVMHIGTKILEAIIRNTSSVPCIFKEIEKEVRFACLLHDIGHAPFSHIGELFFNKKELETEIIPFLSNYENNELQNTAPHELMSALIIKKSKDLQQILSDLKIHDEFVVDMILGRTNYRNF